MVCGLEIVIPVIAAITAIVGLITAISETLPFIKKYSGNGIIHSIYHCVHPEKCVDTDSHSSSDSLSSLG